MSAAGSPARQLLLLLEDEASLASLPIDEVAEELALLGVDPAASIGRARKWASRPAAPPAAPPPIMRAERPEDMAPPVAPVAPVVRPVPVEPVEPVEPVSGPPVSEAPVADASDTAGLGYSTAPPGPDLMADIGIRADSASDAPKKKSGAGTAVMIVLLAVILGGGVAAYKIWPEIADLEQIAGIANGLSPPSTDPGPADAPPEPAPEVSVSRLEPIPPPAPPPTTVEVRPAAPEPAPQPAFVVAEPAPAPQPESPPATQASPESAPGAVPQTPAGTDPGAPLNIVPRVEAPPVQEARLPADVARPFTAPPSIVAIVPVERELLAAAGTGMLSSGSRRSAEETRLAARLEDAQRIAAGRAIAALVTLRSPEESYDAVILKRPRVEEDRTIADADQTLIPIMGDTAHLFDLVRLAPN